MQSRHSLHPLVAGNAVGPFALSTVFAQLPKPSFMRKLLTLLLLPVMATAQTIQPVHPIVSDAYQQRIRQQATAQKSAAPPAGAVAGTQVVLQLKTQVNWNTVLSTPIIRRGTLQLNNRKDTRLEYGGNYTIAADIQQVNRIPALQNIFAQGSNVNGAVVWRGAETNEPFSYGAAIASLEYDGSNYPYDVNGRLVRASGQGKPAAPYDNNIFRTAGSIMQSLQLQGNIKQHYKQQFNFNLWASHSAAQNVLLYNQNTSGVFTGSAGGFVSRAIKVSVAVRHQQECFSNTNRMGLLSRAYQSALLTPASFDNNGVNLLNGIQRSFSSFVDHPLLLLQHNNQPTFNRTQQYAGLTIEKKVGDFRFSINPSSESVSQLNADAYQPGTVFFINGIGINRSQVNNNLFVRANADYNIRLDDYRWRSSIIVNYAYVNASTTIRNNGATANDRYFRRQTHDWSAKFFSTYSGDKMYAGIELVNKAYYSNSASAQFSLLPSIAGYLQLWHIAGRATLKLTGAYNQSAGELPIDRSYAYSNLLRYNTAQWQQYWPVPELNRFDGLVPILHKEWSTSVELLHAWYSCRLNWYSKTTLNDVVPVWINDQLLLQNIANHKGHGIELELNQFDPRPRNHQWHLVNSVGIGIYRNRVTKVADKDNYTAIAGFNNVYKAVVKGYPIGSIVGNGWKRNAQQQMVIGNDGFPMVDNQPRVIGNPLPDFTVKLMNKVSWKKWTLAADWEWRKGGDVWNGTRAVLDYYGRSAASASLRNTRNYIFPGVQENNQPNQTPVQFYDPALPITSNRWVRYGVTGVAEDYIEKADQVRANSIELSHKIELRKFIQRITMAVCVKNIILWQPYRGADPGQLLFDQPAAAGLDFFNLPSARSMGIQINLQF